MQEPTTLSNRFFVCLAGQAKPLPFNPFSYEQNDYPGFIEINYLAEALKVLEQESHLENLTFYITWNTQHLPSYGSNVVAILMGDEWCHKPRYLQNVKTVFRQYGDHPEVVTKTFRKPSQLNFVLLLQFLRAVAHGLPGRLRQLPHEFFCRYVRGEPPAQQYVIPLGYANQLELPIAPMAERPLDIYFAGSLNNLRPSVFSIKYWLQSPKNVARRRAVDSANRLKAKRPELDIQLEVTSEHIPSKLKGTSDYNEEAKRYSQKLMSAKICLVPRGSSLDTPRFFEALRYGCIAIADRLPSKWFYDDAPVIQVDSWSNLEKIVDDLLGNPERLEQLHQDALNYWQTSCSEAVLGRYMAARLISAETVGDTPQLSPNPRRMRRE